MAGVFHKALPTTSQPEFWQQCQIAWAVQNKAAPQNRSQNGMNYSWLSPLASLTPRARTFPGLEVGCWFSPGVWNQLRPGGCCVPGGHPPRRLSPLLVAADLRRLVRPIQSPVGRSEGDQPWLCAPHLGMTLQQNGTDTWPSHLMSESQPTGPEPSDPPPSLLEARSLQGKGLRDPLYHSHHFQECGPEVCVVRWG